MSLRVILRITYGENYEEKINQFQRLTLHKEISQIDGLENLRQLIFLNFQRNRISRIKGLENLRQLNWLSLSNNQIGKIECLGNLCQLQCLYIHDNQISRIEGLENLSQLTYLDLSRNQISRIEGLENLSQLETLYLDNNQISRIWGLENLSKLRHLSLTQNQIKEPPYNLQQYRLLQRVKKIYWKAWFRLRIPRIMDAFWERKKWYLIDAVNGYPKGLFRILGSEFTIDVKCD